MRNERSATPFADYRKASLAARRNIVEDRMTYDPDRDRKAPADVSPSMRPGEGPKEGYESGGPGMLTLLIGLIAVAAIATLAFLWSA